MSKWPSRISRSRATMRLHETPHLLNEQYCLDNICSTVTPHSRSPAGEPSRSVRCWWCARLSRMKALVGRARMLAPNTPATPQSAMEPPSSPAISPFVITTAAGIARCAQPAPDAAAGAGVERGDVAGGARARSLFSAPTGHVEKAEHIKAATLLCDDGLPKVGRLL